MVYRYRKNPGNPVIIAVADYLYDNYGIVKFNATIDKTTVTQNSVCVSILWGDKADQAVKNEKGAEETIGYHATHNLYNAEVLVGFDVGNLKGGYHDRGIVLAFWA